MSDSVPVSALQRLSSFLHSSSSSAASPLSNDERQTEESRKEGNIWSIVRKGSLEELKSLLSENPSAAFVRGAVGELPLHLLFLYNSPAHLAVARYLLDRFPHLTCSIYTGDEYSGENILHIAVINRDFPSVRELVLRQPLLLTGKATGKFFSRGNSCYYGESPLAFSVCTGQRAMFLWLLDNGGVHQLTQVDRYGNNLLHLCVLHSLTDFYTLIKEKCQELLLDSLWDAVNFDHFSPFTLAADEGNSAMFHFLLEERKIPQWKYGPVKNHLIPLKHLDSPLDHENPGNPQPHHPSAVELILQHGHISLLMHPRIISLLSTKWERFCGKIFYKRAGFFISYIFSFFLSLLGHFERDFPVFQLLSPQYALFLFDCLLYCGAGWKFHKEFNEMCQNGLFSYLSSQGGAFIENFLSTGFCVSFLVGCPLIYLNSPYAIPCLASASLFSWFYLFFFLLGFRLTGPLVIMIIRMIKSDVLRFLVLFAVFFMGFSQAFYILFDQSGIEGLLKACQLCFLTTIGASDWENFPFSGRTEVFLLIFYIVLVSVVLLNLLIAMMGDTYEKVAEAAEKEWLLERARIMLSIESEMSLEERLEKENIYWVELNGERFIQVQEIDENYWKTDEKAFQTEKPKSAKDEAPVGGPIKQTNENTNNHNNNSNASAIAEPGLFEIPSPVLHSSPLPLSHSKRRPSVLLAASAIIQDAAQRGSAAAERRYSLANK